VLNISGYLIYVRTKRATVKLLTIY